jgi:DNA adenine methylase
MFSSYLIADSLEPLAGLWKRIINDPKPVADKYESLWLRERERPIDVYYEIRAEFNLDRDPVKLLYLLARCVKNAVRFNPSGDFNQSPDKRRSGTKPKTMSAELIAAHKLLANKSRVVHGDFISLFEAGKPGDLFYLDPPYQGTSIGRDARYVSGVSRKRLIQGLEILNEKRIPFILSYDGFCGDRIYGDPLPDALGHQILLNVGRSSQATLNGRDETTIESLYISHFIPAARATTTLTLEHFAPQPSLFS